MRNKLQLIMKIGSILFVMICLPLLYIMLLIRELLLTFFEVTIRCLGLPKEDWKLIKKSIRDYKNENK